MPQAFQRKSKNLFLTFQNLQEHFDTREEALEAYKEALALVETSGIPCVSLSLCVEFYPSRPDDFHAHALLSWDSSLTHNLNHFKVLGVYPDSKSVSAGRKSLERIVEYFKKDGVFDLGHSFDATRTDLWREVVSASSRNEAYELIKKSFPDKFVCSYNSVRAFLDGEFRAERTPYTPVAGLGEFILPEPIDEWIQSEFSKVSNQFVLPSQEVTPFLFG